MKILKKVLLIIGVVFLCYFGISVFTYPTGVTAAITDPWDAITLLGERVTQLEWRAEKISLNQEESLEIVIYPDNILREVAQPVEKIGPAEQELAQLMINTMERAGGVGLAAPQVGVSKRIIVVKLDRGFFSKEILTMVNPEIIEQGGSVSGTEVCLSIPGEKVKVTRSQWITVKYTGLDGKEVVLTESNLNARIIQHEIDHLNGILIIDYQ